VWRDSFILITPIFLCLFLFWEAEKVSYILLFHFMSLTRIEFKGFRNTSISSLFFFKKNYVFHVYCCAHLARYSPLFLFSLWNLCTYFHTHTHTHCLTLFLSLSHAHTRERTHTLSFSITVSALWADRPREQNDSLRRMRRCVSKSGVVDVLE